MGTAMLPNLNGRYLRADSTPGQMVEAGVPNITGWANVVFYQNTASLTDDTSGVFSSTWQNLNEGASGSDHAVGNLSFNASNQNPIYGNSDTVTPLTYTVRAFICYA